MLLPHNGAGETAENMIKISKIAYNSPGPHKTDDLGSTYNYRRPPGARP